MSDSPATSALPAADTLQPTAWRWGICVFLLLASTLNYMDRMALNQTAFRIKAELQVDDEWYSLLESVFAVSFAMGTLTFGWIVDRSNVRWVYPIAVVGWSMAGFFTGYASGYWTLFGCRLALGVFEAGNWPCGVRTVRQVMPVNERSLGNAFFQNGTALGAIVTPPIVLLCVFWIDPQEMERAPHLAVAGPAAGLSVTGLPPEGVWQFPFRLIGAIGLIWVVLWLLVIPGRALQSVAPDDRPGRPSTSFFAIFSDRRFWLLIAVILAVNISWHTFRVWLPLYLIERHGYSESEMSYFTMSYYISADIGAWVIGFLTMWLIQRGRTIWKARLIAFGLCTAILMVSLAIPFLERGPWLRIAVLTYGFASFGLFPTYFALSQDLSAQHQGKVTGTLGCINGIFLALFMWLAGRSIKELKLSGTDPFDVGPHGTVLLFTGVPALLAFLLIWRFWKVPAK